MLQSLTSMYYRSVKSRIDEGLHRPSDATHYVKSRNNNMPSFYERAVCRFKQNQITSFTDNLFSVILYSISRPILI